MILKPHLSLNASDLDASVAFYRAFFGAEPVKRRVGYAKFDLSEPALNLALVEAPPTGLNVNHFGVQVSTTDDVLEASERLAKAGLLDLAEMGTTCCYAKQDKVWAMDPDGNRWEVFTVLEDAERMQGAGSGCCSAPDAVPESCAEPEVCLTSTSDTGSCGCSRS